MCLYTFICHQPSVQRQFIITELSSVERIPSKVHSPPLAQAHTSTLGLKVDEAFNESLAKCQGHVGWMLKSPEKGEHSISVVDELRRNGKSSKNSNHKSGFSISDSESVLCLLSNRHREQILTSYAGREVG